MGRAIKRLLLLALIGSAALALTRRVRRQRPAEPTHHAPESTWPPIRTVAAVPVPVPEPVAVQTVPIERDVDWVAPDDAGACPITHPIKANANSRIFHVPGGRFYARTKAERCYAEADDAERDGYRQAKA